MQAEDAHGGVGARKRSDRAAPRDDKSDEKRTINLGFGAYALAGASDGVGDASAGWRRRWAVSGSSTS